MFKEGNRECIDKLLIPSKFVLDSGVAIRNEPYDKRQALWNEIKTNADRYRNGDCGKFLSDLAVHFSARFDASLLLLALVFQQNNEQFEGSGYFNASEIEAYETIEKFSYFRILSKNEIARKIKSKDEKTISLLKEYSVSMKPRMDDILGDAAIRDSIRTHLEKQWEDNTKKVGGAIASAGVDLDWFASLPLASNGADKVPQTIIINAGNDAAINLGQGNIIKDAVLTGSTVKSSGGGGSTVKDSVITKSTIESAGAESPANGIRISDSVITSSTVSNVQETPVGPEKEQVAQPPIYMCLLCGTVMQQPSKFCSSCGAKISILCANCRSALRPDEKFCSQCGKKTS
ncbi:MAG: zinc ribbon domain-containing protein [Methanomicrobiales archaeon]